MLIYPYFFKVLASLFSALVNFTHKGVADGGFLCCILFPLWLFPPHSSVAYSYEAEVLSFLAFDLLAQLLHITKSTTDISFFQMQSFTSVLKNEQTAFLTFYWNNYLILNSHHTL